MSFNINSGYDGYSMSNRAREAYDDGEKPLSKWLKSDIINRVLEIQEDYGVFNLSKSELQKFKKDFLVNYFLEKTSWHHTGKYFNQTDFYSVNESRVIEATLENLYKFALEFDLTVENTNIEPILFTYDEFKPNKYGGRKHGRFEKAGEFYGLKIDNTIYYRNGTKKSNGSHLSILEYFENVDIKKDKRFAEIYKKLPDKYLK